MLKTIIDAKRYSVARVKATPGANDMAELAVHYRQMQRPHRLRDAMLHRAGPNIIAEFKRASPSKGALNLDASPIEMASAFREGGAKAISVLTEEQFFLGSFDDLAAVRNAVDLPILQKDFIIDEFQIYQAAAIGADAVLLIAAVLDDDELGRFRGLIENDLRMDALVEVHDEDELKRVIGLGAGLIGVNNRDLRTFDVSLDVCRRLIREIPDDAVAVAESGLSDPRDINELHRLGFSGFLVGEAFMRSTNIEDELVRFSGDTMEHYAG